VAVDTEFLRETTFWPILCVVQVASDDEALAIDGRRTINDLDRAIRNFDHNPNELLFGSKSNLPEYQGGK